MGKRQSGNPANRPVTRRCLYCLTPTTVPTKPVYVPATEQTAVLPGDPEEAVMFLYDQSRLPHHPRVVVADGHEVLPLCELVRLGWEAQHQ